MITTWRKYLMVALACALGLTVAFSAAVPIPPVEAQAQPNQVFSGRADVSNNSAPRWVATTVTPARSGLATFQLNFDLPANLRIEVTQNGEWVGANTSLSNPKRIQAEVTAGAPYRIAVWSMGGASNFNVTLQTAPTVQGSILSGFVDFERTSGPSWMTTLWTAPTTGATDLRLTWETASAEILGTVLRASDNEWIGNIYGAQGTAGTRVQLVAGTQYRVSVWSEAGSSAFRVRTLSTPPPPANDRPNILVIMTDDQRRDSLSDLPKIKKWMIDQGRNYTEGYVTTPACCPARASTLTGQYNHNNGVKKQWGPAFNENTSIAKYLGDAGYATAHIGKYVHYYDLNERAPHWDRWTYYKGGYNNVWMNIDGVVRQPGVYSTNFVFDQAIRYTDEFKAANDDQPWLMHVWPTAPHREGNNPPVPEPKYANAAVPNFDWDPNSFEADISDKPPFMYCCPDLTSVEYISNMRRQMIRTLYSVDDGVDRLLTRLQETGELENTLVFFLSDNGWLYGDHQLHEKFVPYENSVGVPFMVRWPGKAIAGSTSDRFVSNIDILPTALGAAGVPIPANVDGQDIFNESPRPYRFTEYFQDNGNVAQVSSWAAAATGEYQYIEWYNSNGSIKFREFYNRTLDPYQLRNLLADGNPNNDPGAPLLAEMKSRLDRAKSCSGSNCP